MIDIFIGGAHNQEPKIFIIKKWLCEKVMNVI